MIYLSYAAVALTVAVFAWAAVQFTDPEPGRHAASERRTWPPVGRGQHTDARVLETAVAGSLTVTAGEVAHVG